MNQSERIGIIDIGSNSIRLVIYERLTNRACRIIDEMKQSARLSGRVSEDGTLAMNVIMSIADILTHFQRLCRVHRVGRIRAVATAAIRNAANRDEVIRVLTERTGLAIEVLSGEDEARYGFIGMINAIDIEDGFLVDIGGGSTEITLFRQRKLARSVSFPFGAVNAAGRFRTHSSAEQGRKDLTAMVQDAVGRHDWLTSAPGLRMIGIGGTFRALAKLLQRRRRYPLQLTHQFPIEAGEVEQLVAALLPLTTDQLKKIDGLSKDRADIFVPALIVIAALLDRLGSAQATVSGAGLRDGLFLADASPEKPIADDVVAESVRNLARLHAHASLSHVEHVQALSLKLWDELSRSMPLAPEGRKCLFAASMLYRMGTSVHYYNFQRHTFYMMTNMRIDGLSHRETLICALIASFESKRRCVKLAAPYKDIVNDADLELAVRLGALLQLAIALDRSETQPVGDLQVRIADARLDLFIRARHSAAIELREVESLAKDFGKIWELRLDCRTTEAD